MSRRTGLFLIAASCMALGVAWFVEHVMSVMPCELCLAERWPWRILLVIGLVDVLLPGAAGGVVLWLAAPVLLASCALAVCHAGVEWHWWPSPFPACRAPHVTGTTMAERLASMPRFPSKPCDAPTYLIPDLPVSMSVMGGGYAAVVLLIFVKLKLMKKRVFR
ncbi:MULTISPECIES: disulfide bond formation protein B [Acetobacter]|uniref:disulfide bond formation protein B n=1 Tax=Acetobacter TaxID=434 RepID=UPI000A3AD8A7|nr:MULTISPECIES: disulfide bond formation protein B [Acetobacter]MBS0960308.1 disulfide bond formation protein B [Acetobacter thailandicus]MBS0985523.1 disulfide bond formation protein B [Acetobacter thailandicus]MBS1003246.1 disulfide bond formation protein B [Acetobacter thailandicus]OUI87785.1 dihydrolipoamide acyltransferase [Acetobacter sp. DmW_043]OUJ12041.1 dihydrolipoamide acyltransferase [Acetobacter sp. DsW_059]